MQARRNSVSSSKPIPLVEFENRAVRQEAKKLHDHVEPSNNEYIGSEIKEENALERIRGFCSMSGWKKEL